METIQKTIRTGLLKYGSLSEIIKKNGVLVMIDSVIQLFLDNASKRFYRPRGTDYGLSEVFFRSKYIDQFKRYACAIKEVREMESEISVLEIGAGGEGISYFSNLFKKCDFFLFDVRKDAFNGLNKRQAIIGDGCRLPFRDKAFDVIVSVDTVEHIPKSLRHNFYKELKRVCKKRIILTCPIQSSDGIFQGKKYDITFQYLYERNYGVRETNTAQHIAAGHPTLEEIKRAIPDSAIYGYQNCECWLKYMLFSSKPFLGLFCGLLYYFLWKRNNDKPPYWGAIIVSDPQRYSDNVFY